MRRQGRIEVHPRSCGNPGTFMEITFLSKALLPYMTWEALCQEQRNHGYRINEIMDALHDILPEKVIVADYVSAMGYGNSLQVVRSWTFRTDMTVEQIRDRLKPFAKEWFI